MPQSSIRETWSKYSGWLICPGLIFVAWMVNRYVQPYCGSRLVDDFIVALVIAGLLTLTVDPFIKNRARREATLDIFHHMLGFSLPVVIRERLQDMVLKTKLYRKNWKQRISMSEDGDSVVIDVEAEFEVVNPTAHALGFEPLLQFEKGEQAVLRRVICFQDPSCGKNAVLSLREGGLGSVEYRGKEINVPANDSFEFKYEYSVKYPTAMGFLFPNSAYPTIGLELTVKSPQNFKVKATTADFEAPGEWRYPNKLLMPSEHLEIVWEKLN
jgi:hypothetical protein